MKNKMLYQSTRWLCIIGALIWGLTALNYNFVATMLAAYPLVLKIVYGLVGLSGIAQIYFAFKG